MQLYPRVFFDRSSTSATSRNGVQVVGCVWVADGFVFESVQPIDCLPIPTGNKVAVSIDRDLNAAVSELLLDVGEGLTLLDKQRGEGMPQVVNADVAESGLCQELVPYPIAEVAGI